MDGGQHKLQDISRQTSGKILADLQGYISQEGCIERSKMGLKSTFLRGFNRCYLHHEMGKHSKTLFYWNCTILFSLNSPLNIPGVIKDLVKIDLDQYKCLNICLIE